MPLWKIRPELVLLLEAFEDAQSLSLVVSSFLHLISPQVLPSAQDTVLTIILLISQRHILSYLSCLQVGRELLDGCKCCFGM